MYVPVYLKLARDTQLIAPMIEFYTVSCVAHTAVCRNYSHTGYPSVRVFPAPTNSSVNEPGILIKNRSQLTSESLMKLLLHDDSSSLSINDPRTDSNNTVSSLLIKSSRLRRLDLLASTEDDDNHVAHDNENGDADSVQLALVEEGDMDVRSDEEESLDGDIDSSNLEPMPVVNALENEFEEEVEEEDESSLSSGQASLMFSTSDDNSSGDRTDQYVPSFDEKGSDDKYAGDSDDYDSEESNYDRRDFSIDEDESSSNDRMESDANTDFNYKRSGSSIADSDDQGDFNSNDRMESDASTGFSYKGSSSSNAGANLVRYRNRVDRDQWKELIRKHREEVTRKQRKRVQQFTRASLGAKGIQNNADDDSSSSPEGETPIMRANRPGTVEYSQHRADILKQIDLVRRKRRLPIKSIQRPYARPIFRTSMSNVRMAEPEVKKIVTKERLIEKVPLLKSLTRLSAEEELMLDVSLSFFHLMEFGVYTSRGSLPLDRQKVLKDWLDLLTISLPPEWGIHDLISDLLSKFESVVERESNLKEVLRAHSLRRSEWSVSCTARNQRNGFSCGLWKLFHVVTVGVAEHRGGINLINAGLLSSKSRLFSPLQAADALMMVIGNFFTCTPCATHFVNEYKICSNYDRCDRLTNDAIEASSADWKELPKWLWEVHNGVNVRLLNEKADRLEKETLQVSGKQGAGKASQYAEISVLWPQLDDCLVCFRVDGTWNDDAVFVHLEITYW
jgi:hypothetical protein